MIIIKDAYLILNELLVDTFNLILNLEEKNLYEKGVALTIKEVHVLEAIAKVENKTVSNVAKRLQLTVGTLSLAVNRLVTKGYIKKIKNHSDLRIVKIELLDHAKDVLKIHDKFHENMIDSAIKDLNLLNQPHIIDVLKNINDYFMNLKCPRALCRPGISPRAAPAPAASTG